MVYGAGLWLGAQVAEEARVAIAEYSSEFVPGPMANGAYQPDNAQFKVYKVRRSDTPASNPDYANWPVSQGAPVDAYGDPLILGDVMTWSVFNDANPNQHANDAGSTQPVGVEVHHTALGWFRSAPLGNAYFLRYLILNQGGNTLDSAYVSIWADPDLGNASDDLVGCDTLLSLG